MNKYERITKKRKAVFMHKLGQATKHGSDEAARNYANKHLTLMPGEAVYAKCATISLDREL